MKTYAHILSGQVWEIIQTAADITTMFNPALVWVDITSVSPQPLQGWTATETAGTWSFAAPPGPTLVQQAQAAQYAGIAIASTATPTLDATYPTSGPIWADLKDEAQFITTFGGFSSGASSIVFVLSSSTSITFTAMAQLQAVVKAIAMYLSALKTIAATGVGTLPAASVTIA